MINAIIWGNQQVAPLFLQLLEYTLNLYLDQTTKNHQFLYT